MGRVVRGRVYIVVIAIYVAFYFSCTIFSIYVSICLIWMDFSTISFIMSSFMVSISYISLVSGSCVGGNLSRFFRDVISSSFFFIASSTDLVSEGSYPIFIIKSSKDLILVSFDNDEIFPIFN